MKAITMDWIVCSNQTVVWMEGKANIWKWFRKK